MKVLFVCSGNICRSAMAAEYLKLKAARAGLTHVVVDSVGLLGIEGAPAAAEAIEVGREVGLDLSLHRSRGLTEGDVRTADYVIPMTGEHLDRLAARHPPGAETRLLLRAFQAGADPKPHAPDLDDPMGLSLDVFRKTLEMVMVCVDHLVLHIKHGP